MKFLLVIGPRYERDPMAYAEVDDAPTGDKPSKAKSKSRRRKDSTDVEEDESELMTSC